MSEGYIRSCGEAECLLPVFHVITGEHEVHLEQEVSRHKIDCAQVIIVRWGLPIVADELNSIGLGFAAVAFSWNDARVEVGPLDVLQGSLGWLLEVIAYPGLHAVVRTRLAEPV